MFHTEHTGSTCGTIMQTGTPICHQQCKTCPKVIRKTKGYNTRSIVAQLSMAIYYYKIGNRLKESELLFIICLHTCCITFVVQFYTLDKLDENRVKEREKLGFLNRTAEHRAADKDNIMSFDLTHLTFTLLLYR